MRNPRPAECAARQTFHISCGLSDEPEKRNIYKKFCEELIAYFPFTVILVSDTTSRKKALVYTRNKINKTIQSGRF
jgi:hypothetical protein